jgi:DNA-binding NarL/FixJ family response regulator
MESFSHHSLNRNNVVAKLSECIESFVGHCHSAISCIASKVAQLKNRLAIVATPPRNSIVKLKHLHKSYNAMQPRRRAIFTLYIKGYSIDEISALSGAKRSTIKPTVHRIVQNMPRQDYIS